jgi:tight adherence protein B
MDILIIAIISGLIIWLGLLIYDGNKKKVREQSSFEVRSQDDALIQTEKSLKSHGKQIDGLTYYSVYLMSIKEKAFYVCLAGAVLFSIGFVFYQNYIASFLLTLVALYYPRIRTKEIIEKRKQELGLQFKQALYSLASALGAGKSVESAFQEAIKDISLLYPDPNTYIIREFKIIHRRVENGEPIERAVIDFSSRADIEDVTNFADVFVTCKRTGGDLVEVIRRTSNIIGDKLDIQQEIHVLIAQKKFESKILSVAPLLIVALLSLSSPDYMEPLYQFGIGPVVMTIALLLLGSAFWLTRRIMMIKV